MESVDDLYVNLCRICFGTNASVKLFEDAVEFNVASLLESTLSIKMQVSGHASNLICLDCMANLNTTVRFKKDVEQAEDRWNKLYLWILKEEEEPKEIIEHTEKVWLDGVSTDVNDINKDAEHYCQEEEPEIKTQNDDGPSERRKIYTSKEAEHYRQEEEPEIKLQNDDSPSERRKRYTSKEAGHYRQEEEPEIKLQNDDGPSELRKKYTKHKTDDKERICNQCGKEFQNHTNLLNHIRIHTGEKPFQCDVCFKRFSQSGNLIIHQRSHKNWKPYVCGICSKEFTQNGNLQRHMSTHKPNGEFKFTESSKSFQPESFLKNHLTRQYTGVKNYSHTRCDKSLFRTNSLYAQIRTVQNKEKRYVCSKCHKAFSNIRNLQDHFRIHTGEKRYVCAECNKEFSNTSNLQAHFQIHSGENPFECKYCDSKFNQSSTLERHMRHHLKNNDELKPLTIEND